jgi:GR25 family glycosyltransferase involved in LPS biosynthesis
MDGNLPGPRSPATADRPLLWDGFYINLDRAVARRLRLQQQLTQYGVFQRYRRFQAVDGHVLGRRSPCSPGEVGIFRSHLNVIEAIAAGDRPGHVLEDDTLLSDMMAPALDAAILGSALEQFDVLFLEMFVGPVAANISRLHRAFAEASRGGAIRSADQLQIIDLGARYEYGTTSYAASPRGARKLAALLDAEWQRGPTMPLDSLIQREARQGQLRVGCVFPFVTSIAIDSALDSAAGRSDAAQSMLHNLVRYSFFVRRDIAGYAAPLLERILSQVPAYEENEIVDFYAGILRYQLAAAITAGRPAKPATGN